ncbi:hypothetical protein C900_04950 [Fulvivirga imtechensis AK7]|uniref:DUF4249 domain-containing protein n=1 Tax=Fulvivirga imtechensis AK7 TaxID=1237149 RepID=L8JMH0_9BACT|nr:DUF4249 domain-containing protein [Fulvivirga imtechensis]ELR69418.1 hypothetical protein C900_04950 [Fulvivirga imtechensis AK7]
MRKTVQSFLLFLILTACVEPINLKPEEAVEILVVEGGITNIPGRHLVELTMTTRYGDVFDGVNKRVDNALVSVRDDSGNTVLFENLDNGVYQSPENYMAEVGRSYTLLIETADGVRYNSIPQEIVPVPAMEEIRTEFVKIATADPNKFITGMDVIVEFNDPMDNNFYLWESRGVYEVNARPDLHLDEFGQPDPLPCCEKCWVTEVTDNSLRLLNDVNSNGQLQEVKVAFIEDDGIRFSGGYYVKISQMAISREAFDFYKVLDQLLSINGDLFDPPPVIIRGNIVNLDNPDENVIGLFRAAAVVQDSIFIRPDMLDERKEAVLRNDCRNYKNGTVERPEFWY